MEHWRKHDITFRYMMLDRMKQDCEYYLDHGNRNPNVLWGHTEHRHIDHMKTIWNTFSATEKPEWLPYEDIEVYAKEMGVEDGKVLEIYRGQYRGVYISEYGLDSGFLDYRALGQIIEDYIPNNKIRDCLGIELEYHWELFCGSRDTEMIQEFIISENGAEFLKRYTDETVYHNEETDIYIWVVDHGGMDWSDALTNTRLVERG